MSPYQTKTINAVLQDIENRRMYLPAIQRKYVWSEEQINRLMDSIMLNYPIGTFLFWKVKRKVVNQQQYSMYEFIKDYHERDANKNLPAVQPFSAGSSSEDIWSVLDGQQRLTSLYIALQGSLSVKMPKKRWNNDKAFPKKELYFNLRSKGKCEDDDEVAYEFDFLTPEQAQNPAFAPDKLWYRVKDILRYASIPEVMTELINPNHWNENKLIMDNLVRLHDQIMSKEMINYFEVQTDSIDDVLDIFVRINSGGTILSKSDLLFSTIVSYWDKARGEIEELLTSINKKGERFAFSNDFIMRSCLFLMDLSTSLKVESFKKESVEKIKENWERIKNSISATVDMLCEFGFNSENLTSYVAVMPIVYYHFKGGEWSKETKKELKKYLVVSLLRRIFGASTNNTLQSIREVLKQNAGKPFAFAMLEDLRFSANRTLRYSQEDIDELFEKEKGPYTFMVLSLLYPHLKYGQNSFHQDHMHPYASFTDRNLSKLTLPDGSSLSKEKIEEWQYRRNTLANLQLLEGHENGEKNKTPLNVWLEKPENRANVKFLPPGISYDLANFEEFMEKRKALMRAELEKILL